MTLDELQRSEYVQAAKWNPSERQLILSEVLGLSLTEQILTAEAQIADSKVAQILDIAKRSIAGEPLAYILGVSYFDGLKLAIYPEVLIPRPDTETLVEVASAVIVKEDIQLIHDLCTGSGAVALALKARHPNCQISASDLSVPAVQCATQNARTLQLQVELVQGDLFEGLSEFQLITVNPPYIAWDDPEVDSDVVAHEPAIALFSENNGLFLIDLILRNAPKHLVAGGVLCLEHGHRQAHDVTKIATETGWGSIETIQDLAGRDRVTRMHKL
ncbi:MAG: peptide chain release factor N(5)-glutamine methyltransferase [Pseudomonadota bacterium]|nr:peptide chain release factor N(5)-glutamine methyltransferase [Pseudomonadota bacterium]